ncbi:MAG: HEAT repeat domain-containing protein, partial [Candidatus Omnitrophica bacterium]|nr:HEAT repeat domain-containing protein [Candidatus Omnitrophota bacterium]
EGRIEKWEDGKPLLLYNKAGSWHETSSDYYKKVFVMWKDSRGINLKGWSFKVSLVKGYMLFAAAVSVDCESKVITVFLSRNNWDGGFYERSYRLALERALGEINKPEGAPRLPRGPPGSKFRNFLYRAILLILFITAPLNGQHVYIWDIHFKANEYIREAKKEVAKGNLKDGENLYLNAFQLLPAKFTLIRYASAEERIVMLDAYLSENYDNGVQIDIEPKGIMLATKVTKEELYNSCKRMLKYSNEYVSFFAAAALARIGDSLGREKLIKAVERQGSTGVYSGGVENIAAGKAWDDYMFMVGVSSLVDLGDSAAVPHLISILWNTKGYKPATRAYAAYNLSKYRDEGMVASLKKAAVDNDKRVCAAAIFALGCLQDLGSFDVFAAALITDNRGVVNEAITALGKLGDPRAVKLFEEVLKHRKDKETKLRVVFALAQIEGNEAFSLLARLAKDGRAEVRAAAITVLSKFNNPDTKEIFIAALDDPVPLVRAQAALALSAYLNKDPTLVEKLVIIFNKEKDDAVRVAYIKSLGVAKGEEVKGFFTGIVSGKYNEEIRAEALSALADRARNEAEAYVILHEKLDDKSKVVASVAVVRLVQHIGTYPQIESTVKEALVKADLNTRLRILSGLGLSRTLKAVQIIWPYIESTDLAMKHQALLALGRTGMPEVFPALSWAANNPFPPETKQITAIALGLLGSPEGLPVLRELMKHDDPLVYGAAMEGFARIPGAPLAELKPFLDYKEPAIVLNTLNILRPVVVGDADLTKKYVELAKPGNDNLVRSMATIGLGGINNPDVFNVCLLNTRSLDWLLRQSAATAFGKMSSDSAVVPLMGLLQDKNLSVCQAALEGLQGRVANNPVVANGIKPFLDDPRWQMREAAVNVLSKSTDNRFSVEALIPRLQDNSSAVSQAARMGLAQKLTEDQKLIVTYPVLKELEPWIKEYQSKPGAIVVVYEGLDVGDKHSVNGVREAGWSSGLLLTDTLNLMNKLSSGKIEFREGNWSGNWPAHPHDVAPVAQFLYKAWEDARSSGRELIVIGNSYANRVVPEAFQFLQKDYSNPNIKANLFIGTGYPGLGIFVNLDFLRTASIREPVLIGSTADKFPFMTPYALAREYNASYIIFPSVQHAGYKGYFDHPYSVSTIIGEIGFTTPILPKINLYSDVLSLSQPKIENKIPRFDDISNYRTAPINSVLMNIGWQQIVQPNSIYNPKIDYSSTFGLKMIPTIPDISVPNISVPRFQQPAFNPLPNSIQITPYHSIIPAPIYTPPINIMPPAPVNIPIPNFNNKFP